MNFIHLNQTERNDVLKYTSQIKSKIFKKLFESLGSSKKKIKRHKSINQPKFYHRLETDSSEEESKLLNQKKSKKDKTKENALLKDEILRKDREISELKQLLTETQNQLATLLHQIGNETESIQENQILKSENIQEEIIGKEKSELQIEEMIFVSKKETFHNESILIGSRTKHGLSELVIDDTVKISSKKLLLDSESIRIDNDTKKRTVEGKIEEDAKINLEDSSIKELFQEGAKPLEESFAIGKETFNEERKNDEIHEEHLDKASSISIEDDLEDQYTLFSFENHDPIIKNENSQQSLLLSNSIKVNEKPDSSIDNMSQQSVRDLEKMLENEEIKSKDDSQSKLSKLFTKKQNPQEIASETFSKNFNKSKNSFIISNEDSNILDGKDNINSKIENYTFEPIFPMIDTNYDKQKAKTSSVNSRLNSKQENRRSRNSSLP